VKKFFILFFILFLYGCHSNKPKIVNPIGYSYSYDDKSKEIIISKVKNSEFVFVKKGNVYYLKKKSELNNKRKD
jgi:hypothetical protein